MSGANLGWLKCTLKDFGQTGSVLLSGWRCALGPLRELACFHVVFWRGSEPHKEAFETVENQKSRMAADNYPDHSNMDPCSTRGCKKPRQENLQIDR
jgi:hypothetical protein